MTPTLVATEGDETFAPTVATTFPAGLVPAVDPTVAGYTCTTSGQVVKCTSTDPGPWTAGTSLPTVRLPFTVTSGTTGTKGVTAKVGSNDAAPAVATHSASVSTYAASATPGSVAHGTDSTLAVSGLPVAATGTVAFREGAPRCAPRRCPPPAASAAGRSLRAVTRSRRSGRRARPPLRDAVHQHLAHGHEGGRFDDRGRHARVGGLRHRRRADGRRAACGRHRRGHLRQRRHHAVHRDPAGDEPARPTPPCTSARTRSPPPGRATATTTAARRRRPST
nr:hypothetical protein [Angustibacter aerolatus]